MAHRTFPLYRLYLIGITPEHSYVQASSCIQMQWIYACVCVYFLNVTFWFNSIKFSILIGSSYFQVVSVMSMWTRVQPAYAANMWNEALNKRLGTEVVMPLLSLTFFILGV